MEMSLKSEAKRRKANEYERKRVKRLKEAYDELQSHLPSCRGGPQLYLPKVKILRQAAEYIRTLDMILNFPFLLPSNGVGLGPRPTRHVSSDQIQPYTQWTGSSLLTENENRLLTSDKSQTDDFFQMARERNGCFLFNSARSASHLLKQMAEESKKSTSHENALSFYPPYRGLNSNPPLRESPPSPSYCETTFGPCDWFSSPNFINGLSDESVDPDEYHTDEASIPTSPYPCKCHSLPLRHFEISEESADKEEIEHPPFAIK